MYSVDNHGWLLLRETGHSGSISSLSPQNGGLISINLAKYCSPQIWFCPDYRDVNVSQADLMPDSVRLFLVQIHRPGYGFFGAYWDGTAPAAAGPNFGSIVYCKYTNPIASKSVHLKPYMIRMTEWFAANYQSWGSNGGSKWHTGVRNKGPEGGNILFGDGHVAWSRNIFVYFGGERYTIPEGYPTGP
jgi:prepilin-type processing-associated H-X9-DG protein